MWMKTANYWIKRQASLSLTLRTHTYHCSSGSESTFFWGHNIDSRLKFQGLWWNREVWSSVARAQGRRRGLHRERISAPPAPWWPRAACAAATLQPRPPLCRGPDRRPRSHRDSQGPPHSSLRTEIGLHSSCGTNIIHAMLDLSAFAADLYLSYSRARKRHSGLRQIHRASLPPGTGWAGSSPPRS